MPSRIGRRPASDNRPITTRRRWASSTSSACDGPRRPDPRAAAVRSGRAMAEAFAGAGARVAVSGRTRDALDARSTASRPPARTASRSPATRPTRPTRSGWSRETRRPLRPPRHHRQRRRRRRRQGPPPGRGLPARRVGLDHGAQRPQHAHPDAGRRPGDDRRRVDGGAVLNITSVRAVLGINAGYSAYVAAKGAIASLTRQWATEWAKHGIRVNAIMPTFVDTPQVAIAARRPGVQGRHRQPHPARARRRDARPRRPGDLPRAPTPRRS